MLMSSFDSLRRVLNSKAAAASNVSGLDGRIQLMNEEYSPPKKQVFAEFWYKTGGTMQAELGGNTSEEMTVGIYEFNIFAPENQGDGPALQVADLVRPLLNRKEWLVEPYGYVKMLMANVTIPFSGAQNGYFRVCVEGRFHYYHRDPNAPNFRE